MLTNINETIHSSIMTTPYEAAKPSNAIDGKSNIESQASFTRKYQELEIGSSDKIYIKNHQDQKERVIRFSHFCFTINNTTEQHGHNYYKVEGIDRAYLRVELLKV